MDGSPDPLRAAGDRASLRNRKRVERRQRCRLRRRSGRRNPAHGQNNVIGYYRIGSGSAGNVAPGAISTLAQRPLGVSGVTNPQAAAGGADPESMDEVRSNAPDRADPGPRRIRRRLPELRRHLRRRRAGSRHLNSERSLARRVRHGRRRRRRGPSARQSHLANLVTALKSYSNPLIPVTAVSFMETLFGFSADVKYDPTLRPARVQAAIWRTLVGVRLCEPHLRPGRFRRRDRRGHPGRRRRRRGQRNRAHAAPEQHGRRLANLSGGFTVSNWNAWMSQQVLDVPRPSSDTASRICPYVPVPGSQGLPLPAEILSLSPNPAQVTLGTMS